MSGVTFEVSLQDSATCQAVRELNKKNTAKGPEGFSALNKQYRILLIQILKRGLETYDDDHGDYVEAS